MPNGFDVIALPVGLIGVVMMRWPKRDLQNDFLGMKWREIIGLLLCGLAILLHFAGAHSWHP